MKIDQNKYLKVGKTVFLSSGRDDLGHLSTHEYYDGSEWKRDGMPGVLIQLVGKQIRFLSHDGNGTSGHKLNVKIEDNGKLTARNDVCLDSGKCLSQLQVQVPNNSPTKGSVCGGAYANIYTKSGPSYNAWGCAKVKIRNVECPTGYTKQTISLDSMTNPNYLCIYA